MTKKLPEKIEKHDVSPYNHDINILVRTINELIDYLTPDMNTQTPSSAEAPKCKCITAIHDKNNYQCPLYSPTSAPDMTKENKCFCDQEICRPPRTICICPCHNQKESAVDTIKKSDKEFFASPSPIFSNSISSPTPTEWTHTTTGYARVYLPEDGNMTYDGKKGMIEVEPADWEGWIKARDVQMGINEQYLIDFVSSLIKQAEKRGSTRNAQFYYEHGYKTAKAEVVGYAKSKIGIYKGDFGKGYEAMANDLIGHLGATEPSQTTLSTH